MGLLIGDLLATAAEVNPRGIAATLGEKEVTYRELDQSADRLARCLVGAGVRPGNLVAWYSHPSLTSIAGFAAVARTGAVFASLNPAYSEPELTASLDYLQPSFLVAGATLAEAASASFDGPMAAIGAGVPGPLRDLEGFASPAGTDALPARLDDSSPHVVYLTSGTTGTPKGVVVSHRASWLRSFPGGSTFATGLRGDGGILAAFPLFHYGGWHYVLEAWHHRCAFHACDRFDGATLTAVAVLRRPSAMYCIPAVWERVLEQADSAALTSVLHADTGTSAAPMELLERLSERMPQATRSVLYGSSEGGHHSTLFEREIAGRPGSVGRVAPPGTIRVSADGEILYRSPTVMSAYLYRPEETAWVLRDGWYHTGDLGVMDGDGYVCITGRLGEVIRTGGETVAPVEVETALRGCPGVLDAAVLGAPDPTWGEIVTAVVVVAPGFAVPTVEDLRAHIGERLSPFKHPRALKAVEAIPRTAATGQVQRTLLREQLTRAGPVGS